ncbi:MAG: DUF397 domain-containing protein [Dactylosporangium sp.]|nr:DUF397 domain-containing protein [Dactylosporangium sp.]NNJ63775.1 DUF397 domain-containing protein [Dactylosporangium sp.]
MSLTRSWTKSSASGPGDCVEVAFAADQTVYVRDSKDSAGPALAFTGRSWATFLTTMGGFVGDSDLGT